LTLDLADVRRLSRQIALAEFGSEGQARVCAAEVALVGEDLTIETASMYLAGAGVKRSRKVARQPDGAAWCKALSGSDLVLRSGFEDDAMLKAAVRMGIPVVMVRASTRNVDLIAFRRHGPCPHVSLDIASGANEEAPLSGAEAVVAGTLAATEVLWILASGDLRKGPRARHLRLPLDPGGEPRTQKIPWSPECFVCGGSSREVSFQ
jgi:hypothetical protein